MDGSNISDADLDKLSPQDLQALSKNDLDSMSTEGLTLLAHGSTAEAPQETSWTDRAKQLGHATVDALPMIGGMAGGAIGGTVSGVPTLGLGAPGGAIVGAGVGGMAGTAAKNFINSYIDPEQVPKDLGEATKSTLMGGASMAAMETGGQALNKGLEMFGPKLGKYLGSKAESLFGNATGLTGRQISQLPDGALRAAMDNGVGGAFKTQAQIAESAQDLLGKQGETIGSIVKELSDGGATGSKTDLLSGIDKKIAELGNDPAQANVVNQLKGLKEQVAAGPETPTLSEMETSKRGFQKMVNYNDPENQAAKAAVADVYKTSGEDVAMQANPEAAQKFQDAKKLYSQISPIADAAGRKALNGVQSSVVPMTDYLAYGAGGLPAVVAKKAILPRVTSTLSAGADLVSKLLTDTPQVLGRFAAPLQAAAQRGPQALAASHYVLQQQNEEYRNRINSVANPDQHMTNINDAQ